MSKIKTPQSGETGQLSWLYDPKEQSLTLSGAGAIPDYPIAKAPWHELRKHIKAIVLREGVTRIGDYAFYDLSLIHIYEEEPKDEQDALPGNLFHKIAQR